mgnify:CR=1 FL=1
MKLRNIHNYVKDHLLLGVSFVSLGIGFKRLVDTPKYKATLTGLDGKQEILYIGDENSLPVTSVNEYSSVDIDIS